MNLYQQKFDKEALEGAWSKYQTASRQNEELNKEHKEQLRKFHDNIAIYSAGAITFSTTIIGLVLEKYPDSLRQIMFMVPNVYFIYISWFFFVTALITALIYKRIDAYYLMRFGMAYYTKEFYNYVNKQIDMYSKYPENSVFETTYEDQLKEDQKKLNKLEKAYKDHERARDDYYKSLTWASRFAQGASLLGVISLILFIIFLTQATLF